MHGGGFSKIVHISANQMSRLSQVIIIGVKSVSDGKSSLIPIRLQETSFDTLVMCQKGWAC